MAGQSNSKRGNQALGLLAAPMVLLAVVVGMLIVTRSSAALFGWVAGGLGLVVVLWIVASVLWPGTPDRRCDECGAEALERLDEETTQGLVCKNCGWEDETVSSFLHAEEETVLEPIALLERERRRKARRAPVDQG